MFRKGHLVKSYLLWAAVLVPLSLTGCTEPSAGGASHSSHTTQVTRDVVPGTIAAAAPSAAPLTQPAAQASSPQPPSRPVRPAGQLRDITFDTIKFQMDKKEAFKRSMITPQIEDLSGQKVRIRGYILPSFKQHGLTQFVLVRDNMQCCFGPGAALYDCVIVQMEPNTSAEFSVRPVAVEGVFGIEIVPGIEEHRPLAIYRLLGKSVK